MTQKSATTKVVTDFLIYIFTMTAATDPLIPADKAVISVTTQV